MANNKQQHNPPPESMPDCEERDNATQLSINTIKKTYCDTLRESWRTIKKLEKTYEGKESIYKEKQRRYLRTQNNYNRYVNTEINVGAQLVEANVRITTNVANYKKWDDDLAKALMDFFNVIKDVKNKTYELRGAASTLCNSRTDSCSAGQWIIITGKNPEGCKDEQTPPAQTGGHCKDIEDTIEALCCMPKALAMDVDSIFKASADIIGIQKFCNTGSLVALQADLSKKATDFDGLLQATITTRKADLDTCQKELVKSLQERTDAVIDVYNQRCDYDGVYRTVDEICCPRCGCVKNSEKCDEPRLKDCECRICDICGEVRDAFTIATDNPAQPANAPANA